MVVPGPDGELIYLDRNRNGHLEDDGPPVLFPSENTSLNFDIVVQEDDHQRTRIRFSRKPDLPDSELVYCLTSTGDLNPRFARFWATANSLTSYSGQSGTFFFDTRYGYRQASFPLDSQRFEVGLLDWSNNGLFDDDDDLLLVKSADIQDGHTFDEYSLTDVFKLGEKHIQVSAVDKYGDWIDLRVTTQPITSRLANERPSSPSGDTTQVATKESLWNTSFTTIDGRPFDISKFKGKTVLLNFWGEWCKPCVAEIPTLVEVNRQYGSGGLVLISLVNSRNLDHAKALVREKHMSWPQLILTEMAARDFGIRAYPTNILIRPDGSTYVQKGQLSKSFLDSHIGH